MLTAGYFDREIPTEIRKIPRCAPGWRTYSRSSWHFACSMSKIKTRRAALGKHDEQAGGGEGSDFQG
jgi:hypothetical protein